MKVLTRLLAVAVLVCGMAVPLVGCEDEPADEAEEAVEEVGDEIEEATD